jgi:hypothetical protein
MAGVGGFEFVARGEEGKRQEEHTKYTTTEKIFKRC